MCHKNACLSRVRVFLTLCPAGMDPVFTCLVSPMYFPETTGLLKNGRRQPFTGTVTVPYSPL